ncbi:hypothetical protein EVAR_50045_1 [Eumeta japonica]|uniref:Uncharacterized protein n=1 Tax=Eumeta variegata TaxID=151549 RepID=A0A4C1XLC6_EUMVA|nr:hypothetical protein EVAR_50045_1 [Eumeta japonica]
MKVGSMQWRCDRCVVCVECLIKIDEGTVMSDTVWFEGRCGCFASDVFSHSTANRSFHASGYAHVNSFSGGFTPADGRRGRPGAGGQCRWRVGAARSCRPVRCVRRLGLTFGNVGEVKTYDNVRSVSPLSTFWKSAYWQGTLSVGGEFCHRIVMAEVTSTRFASGQGGPHDYSQLAERVVA